jgi:uncharacterized protein YjbI with pentapeptide repeats
MANPKQIAIIHEGVGAWNAWREQNHQAKVKLTHGRLSGRKLIRANLHAADLSGANMVNADLSWANLAHADLRRANLAFANLTGADLTGADLRSASLQNAFLDRCRATGVSLWETQRAGWSIQDILCESAFWDENAKHPTAYGPHDFERLHSDRTHIELLYPSGMSSFELNTLPALIHHLASLNPGRNLRLRSIEEITSSESGERGARISIGIGDADAATADKIQAEATQALQDHLTYRIEDEKRAQLEKDVLAPLIDRLAETMLSTGAVPNIFSIGAVSNLTVTSGQATTTINQAINDNSSLLALIETILTHRGDLHLAALQESQLNSELQIVKSEIQRTKPDQSVLRKGMHGIQELVKEAIKGAAGKFGELAMTTDWSHILHQLSQFMTHLN